MAISTNGLQGSWTTIFVVSFPVGKFFVVQAVVVAATILRHDQKINYADYITPRREEGSDD